MASYKNSTRKRTRTRSKKTYRKKYRKTASKRMMGGRLNPFSTLFSGIAGNISLFRSNAKEEATTLFDTKTKQVKEKVAEAKTRLTNTKNAVADRAKCIAACASAK
jgi:hypothetical protein